MTTFKRSRDFTVNNYNKIAVIKALRSISGVGLKEAKDAVEMAADGIAFEFDAPVALNESWDEMQDIKANGFTISQANDAITIVLESVKQNAIFCTNNGDNGLARLLLSLLDDYEQMQKDREADIIRESIERKEREHADKIRRAERDKIQNDRDLAYSVQAQQEEERRLMKREYETRIRNNMDAQE